MFSARDGPLVAGCVGGNYERDGGKLARMGNDFLVEISSSMIGKPSGRD